MATSGIEIVLATKLHAPRRRGVVERPRLGERIAAGLPALTLVSAPAGFGKTTLVATWFARPHGDERPAAWLSLDERDNEPAVFWSYVVAALQTVLPGVGANALSSLQEGEPLESVVASLLNDLAAVDDDVVLVLDDYHVVESTVLHDSMAFFVEHLPPHVHLVLAGRADPPLPLARLRARGDLLEVRASDLRFTDGEAATYLNETMGLHLTAADVDALEARTEGWIAALQLAALSVQGRDDVSAFITSFAGDDRFVVDYLVEEVLERQPDEIRTFLLDTSILDRFTGALCDAVTGRSGGRSTLEQLDRANLFLVPLDDRRLWYRYHHLFADVLRARLLDEAPERVDDLHRRASDWYETSGDLPEAIDHAFAGHDVERAARLVELAAPVVRRNRQEVTLRRWLAAIPDELFPARPVLAITLVGARMVTGETAGVEELLQHVEHWLEPGTDGGGAIVFDREEFERLPAQVEVYRAGLALVAADTAGTIEHAGRALDHARPTDHVQRGAAAALLALALWSTGDLEGAQRRYVESIASLRAAGHISDVLGCSLALADVQLARGRLSDAMRTYDDGLALAEAHGVLRGTADMHVGSAEVLLERNDVDAARARLDTAIALGVFAGLPQNAYRERVALARLRQADGDERAALDLLDEAEHAYNTDMSPPVRPAHAVKARLQLATGDVAAARRWAADHHVGVDDDLAYVREYEHVTLARILLAERDAGTVAFIERLLAAAEEGQRAGTAVELHVLLALAHHARGDDAAATAALEPALAAAETEGYARVFVDELPALAPLLRAVGGDHARRILATTGPLATTPPAAPGPGLVDELSARELEVLRLLRSDLSGPDIARELVVSLNTLRTHTKNIYTKLGVTSRREAVRRAAELHL